MSDEDNIKDEDESKIIGAENEEANNSRVSGYSADQDSIIDKEILNSEIEDNLGELDDPNITHIADDDSQNPSIQSYKNIVVAANNIQLFSSKFQF